MAKETANLDIELVERLTFLRDETNKLVIVLGQGAVQIRALEKQLEEIKERQRKYFSMNDKYTHELNERLNLLEKDYTNGQVDLEKGTIIYDK